MKNKFLYLALLLLVISYVNEMKFNLLFLLLGMSFYYVRYRYAWKAITLIFIFIIMFQYYQPSNMQSNVLQINEIRTNYVIATDGKKECLLYGVESVVLDDIIEVRGSFEEIHSTQNLNTYQFSKQMKRRNIEQTMNVVSYQVIEVANSLRSSLYRSIANISNKEVRNNALKVLYRIDEEKNDFSYYLYASGIHLSFLISCICKLINKNRNSVAMIVSVMYMLCLGNPFFIQRIFFFSLISIIFCHYNQKDILGLSIIVCLLYKPAIVYELCFIIPVFFRMTYLFNIVKLNKRIVSLLILFPLMQFFFHETNIFLILLFPLFKCIQGIHFMTTLASLFLPLIYPFISLLENGNTAMIKLVKLDFFTIIGKPYVIWMFIWFYIVLLLLTNYKRKYTYILIGMMFFQTQLKIIYPFYEVSFLDVGQGDTILIREPFNGQVILIDVAGHRKRDVAKLNVYPYLKAKGIKKIDQVIITHDDLDHSGGLKSLQQLMNVEKVITKKKNINLDTMKLHSIANREYEDKNDNSIVLFMQIYQKRMLFMGDASKQVELDIMKEYDALNTDVIKIGHHGSKTSSDLSFLQMLKPQVAIISSGHNNFYGHPHSETLSSLKKNQVSYLQTKEVGSIHFYFLPFVQFVGTGRGEFGIME